MNTKGVNFQPSKRGQFSAAVDTQHETDESFLIYGTRTQCKAIKNCQKR